MPKYPQKKKIFTVFPASLIYLSYLIFQCYFMFVKYNNIPICLFVQNEETTTAYFRPPSWFNNFGDS